MRGPSIPSCLVLVAFVTLGRHVHKRTSRKPPSGRAIGNLQLARKIQSQGMVPKLPPWVGDLAGGLPEGRPGAPPIPGNFLVDRGPAAENLPRISVRRVREDVRPPSCGLAEPPGLRSTDDFGVPL